MTVEQVRERMLVKIQERLDEFKKDEDDTIYDVFMKFTKFKNTIELSLSLGLISMNEYLKWDTEGDHLFHIKKGNLKSTDKKEEE